MKLKWLGAIGLSVILAGCSASLEEQIETGFAESETTFNKEAEKPNMTIENIEVYLPEGFKIVESEVENNYLISNAGQQYVLFVNELENSDSKLAYEQLQAEKKENIIEEQTFTTDDVFGFTAVVEVKDEEYECIVSIGGIKMTSLTEAKDIDVKLASMMQIVKSVKMKGQ